MHFFHPRWPVLYEDNHLLALYKPSGLVVQRDYKNRANLLDLSKMWIKERYCKPGNVFIGMVHRLDGPVAGVLVLARTSKAAARLSAQFREKRVDKRYLAVVEGRPPGDEGLLEHYLERQGRKSRVVDPNTSGGKMARLRFHLLAHSKGRSLLDVALETGRRHQIRTQLAASGCPILGDVRYGAQRPMAYGRIALLSRHLVFDHPTRTVRIHLKCPAPYGWPWPLGEAIENNPLWSIEDYAASPDGLPFDFRVNPASGSDRH
jgi:23S rRNA pseudouridine1911/1915/1917 synthase